MGKVNDLLSNNDVLIVFHTCYLLPKCNIAYYWKSSINQMLLPFLVAVVRIISNRWIQTTGRRIKNQPRSKSLITY